MVQISQVAEAKELMPAGTTDAIKKMVAKFNLPIAHEPWDEVALYEALTHDKKTRGSNIKIIETYYMDDWSDLFNNYYFSLPYYISIDLLTYRHLIEASWGVDMFSGSIYSSLVLRAKEKQSCFLVNLISY